MSELDVCMARYVSKSFRFNNPVIKLENFGDISDEIEFFKKNSW